MKKDSTTNKAPLAPASTEPKGSSSAHAKVNGPKAGTLVKKKNTASGDPYTQAKPSRTKVTATGGARYGIRVRFSKSVAPEATATQANGRLFSAAVKRGVQAPHFEDGKKNYN